MADRTDAKAQLPGTTPAAGPGQFPWWPVTAAQVPMFVQKVVG